MKIGFSFGRCIRDIADGKISLDDVAFIISATDISDREQIRAVILEYSTSRQYLKGIDHDLAMQIAYDIWDTSRLIQPRRQGLPRHRQPAGTVWVDMFPTVLSDNTAVKNAWTAYRTMINMVENIDTEALETFKNPSILS